MNILLVHEGPHDEAVLGALIPRLIAAEVNLDPVPMKSDEVHVHREKGKGSRLFKRIVGWQRAARRRGCDAIVLVVDEDGKRERIKDIDRAQEDLSITIRRAVGLAIRTIDAWILADEQALSRVLNRNIDRPKLPETVRNPKSKCRELGVDSRHLYASVADQADLDRMRESLPRGFAPFARRVERLAEAAA